MTSATTDRIGTTRPGAMLGVGLAPASRCRGLHLRRLGLLLLGLLGMTGACTRDPGTGSQDQGITDGLSSADLGRTGDGGASLDAAGSDGTGAVDAAGSDGAGAVDAAGSDGAGGVDAAGSDGAGAVDAAGSDGAGAVDAAGSDGARAMDAAGSDGAGALDASPPNQDQGSGGGMDMAGRDMTTGPANLGLRGAGFTSGGTLRSTSGSFTLRRPTLGATRVCTGNLCVRGGFTR